MNELKVCKMFLLNNKCVSFGVQEQHKQLEEVTKNTEIVEIRQREAECELEASRDRVQQQATEILLKASEISPNLSITSEHEFLNSCFTFCKSY